MGIALFGGEPIPACGLHVVLRHAPKHGAGGYSIQPVDAPVPESCTVHSTMIAEFDLLDVAGGPAIRKPR